jgi:hypothetical protein
MVERAVAALEEARARCPSTVSVPCLQDHRPQICLDAGPNLFVTSFLVVACDGAASYTKVVVLSVPGTAADIFQRYSLYTTSFEWNFLVSRC